MGDLFHARSRLALVVALIGLAAGVAGAAPQTADPFLDEHRERVRLNQPRVDFQIRFKGGRTSFNPREPIEIELVFDPPDVLPFMPDLPCRGWALADVVIDPVDGVATPQQNLCEDLAEQPPVGVLGGRPGGLAPGIGGPAPPPRPPLVLRLTVNDLYRFDRPGRYRLYVRSAHAIGDGSELPPHTSNVLTFTVTDRDAADEEARVQAATAKLESATTREQRLAGLRELRRLASIAAAPSLARFYPSSVDESELADTAIGGLLMVPDRAAAVAAMEAELRRPVRALSPTFVRDLASLEVARRGTPRPMAHAEYLALVERYAAERARLLDAVPGRLEAAFLEDMLLNGRAGGFYRGVLGPVTRRYPREVTAAFAALDASLQRELLTGSWGRFADRTFVPLVRRLALAPTANDDGVRDIALRRWHELAPREARGALRRELAHANQRVSIDTLGRLEEPASVALQREWLQVLQTSEDAARLTWAAQRLERFGTHASAADVARVWQKSGAAWRIEAAGAVIAFQLRVDPRAGLAALHAALDQWTADGADPGSLAYGLLWVAGDREWIPALEPVAIAALGHRDRVVRDDATRLLRAFGSTVARGAIERRLAAENTRLASQVYPFTVYGSKDAHDPDDTLGSLASALARASGWRLGDDEARAWARRCATHACRSAFEAAIPRAGSRIRTISVKSPTPGAERDHQFTIDGVVLIGEAALLAKLAQYPRGERFGWDDRGVFRPEIERWPPAERARLGRGIARRASELGLVIEQTVHPLW